MAHAASLAQALARGLTADRTDYAAVLGAWGRGFWEELDFRTEAARQQRFRDEVPLLSRLSVWRSGSF